MEVQGRTELDQGVEVLFAYPVNPLIEAASKEYVGANAGWPKRTEACDKSS